MAEAKAKKPEKKPQEVFVNNTPPGEKKDMSVPALSEYNPEAVEAAWDDWWYAKGFYRGDETDTTRPPYVLMLPPPNVTGALHVGHALTNSIQDTVARFRRMQGYNVLWLPGTDHAGISTQVIVEKKLKKDRGIDRHALGREPFIEEVWKWKEEYGTRICNQLKRMGSSLDWSRLAFTMDDNLSAGVKEAFLRMHKGGIIYRGARLVNWDISLKSAVSDLEVDYITLDGPTKLHVPGYERMVEFGVLTLFAYKVVDSEEEIVVATTRVETMLGDTAVAVHPEDPRYKHLHGKFLQHPFVDRKIKIICDAELVDMAFGTGAVKVTPAHDPNDFATGQRHNLEQINIFTDDGLINEHGGEKFAGMKRFDARYAITAALKEINLFRDSKPNPGMRVPLSERTKDVIEPMIKFQWWVDCKDVAAKSCAAVRDGSLKIIPDFHEATWFRFLENIRDWCISRQLWWGHRIPAYYVTAVGAEATIPLSEDLNRWIVAGSLEEATAIAREKFPEISAENLQIVQDPDVLDTWFSSGLFPFSTLGWPNTEHPDFKAFFPNALLETGHDILFFWVARMVMMSIFLTGKIPFDTVYLHAMIRDAHGRKMSKGLGNVIDPLDVISGISLPALQEKLLHGNLDPKEVQKAQQGQSKDFPKGIPQCGTDALRFGLCDYTSQGRDINLDVLRIEGYRHMCNKIWQATRFSSLNLTDFTPSSLPAPEETTFINRWILSRLDATVDAVTKSLETWIFGDATKAVYHFFYYEFCDVYVELSKAPLNDKTPEGAAVRQQTQETLYTVLDSVLRLFHPFMPFVTEELWQRLPRREGDKESIMISAWPSVLGRTDAAAEADMKLLQDVIKEARSMRDGYGIKPSLRPEFFFLVKSEDAKSSLTSHLAEFRQLASAGETVVLSEGEAVPEGCGMRPVGKIVEIHLQLKGMVDVQSELKNLEKKKTQISTTLVKLKERMAVPTYAEKVPEAVRAGDVQKLAAMEEELDVIEKSIVQFSKLA